MRSPTSFPVEIWRQILLTVIALPQALDMVINITGCYWLEQDVYHDERAYYEMERTRKSLRLVCRNWKNFADEHQYRWITYDSRDSSKPARQREAVEALEAIRLATNHSGSGEFAIVKPKRISFPVVSEAELQLFQGILARFLHKVKTLCLESPSGYQDEVFSALIRHKGDLPSLCCLMVTQPRNCSTPLLSISKAFPSLIGLTMSCQEILQISPEDRIRLPCLENLYLDVPSLEAWRLEGWEMPVILRLVIPVSTISVIDGNCLDFLKLYGSRLLFLVLNNHRHERLPIEFWTWCPVLTELAGRFSEVQLVGPIPSNHPLNHIIHFPASTFLTEAQEDGLLWQNIEVLPNRLKSIIVSSEGGWSGYLRRLQSCPMAEVKSYLQRLTSVCAQKQIRVEDEGKITLDAFLATL